MQTAKRTTSRSTLAPQIAVCGDRDLQLSMSRCIDLEIVDFSQVSPQRGQWIVALVPGAVADGCRRELLDERVEHHTEAARRHQRRVRSKLGEHVIVRVVGVEAYEDSRPRGGVTPNLRNDRFVDTGT